MPHAMRLRLLLPALVGLALAAPPSRALPEAGAYPSRKSALKQPSDIERRAFDLIQKKRTRGRGNILKWDGQLSAVAREHSKDMADYHYLDYVSPRLGSFDYRIHRAGVSAPNSRYVIFKAGKVKDLFSNKERTGTPFYLQAGTHMGIGIVSSGFPRQLHVTVISREMHSTIEPFPTKPLLNKAYRLAASIERPFTDPQLIITLPNGKVTEKPLELSADRRIDTIVHFNKGAGKYTVEVTATGKLGPEVLDLMHCYAGVRYPRPDTLRETVKTPKNPLKAAQAMFRMVNKARDDAGLPSLKYDERLAAVARAHSQDMLRNKFFKHVSPTRGDLSARMARARLKARRFTENLANNRNLSAAHRGLMNSPGHRRNILDPEANRVGIGVVRTPEDQLLITQNFSQDFRIHDTNAVATELRTAVNAARAEANLAPLKNHSVLSSIALTNSHAMKRDSKLGFGRAQELLSSRKLHLKSIQIAVLQSTDPPKPEEVAKTLDQKYDVIGVGVVQGTTRAGEKFLWTTVLLGVE